MASRRLGRSPETIRRQIKDGTFEYPCEREAVARGSTKDRFMIRMPQASVTPNDASESTLAITERLLETTLAQAEQIADLRERAGRAEAALEAKVAAWEQAVIDYGEQAERAIRAEAERDALAAQLAASERAREATERRGRWWRFWK